MEIKLSKNSGGIFLLELEGDLDLPGSNQLKDYIIQTVRIRIKRFIISLENVEHINSAGIGALIYVFSTLRKLNCTLIMVVPEGPVFEALEISRLKNYFSIVHTMKDALQITNNKQQKSKGNFR